MKMKIGYGAKNTESLQEFESISEVRIFNNLSAHHISMSHDGYVFLYFNRSVFSKVVTFMRNTHNEWSILCLFCDCVTTEDVLKIEKELIEEYKNKPENKEN